MTGDTDPRTEGAAYGGFGAVMKRVRPDPSSDRGHIGLLFEGDAAHAGVDNVNFRDRDRIVFVEDAGDTLHAQRNALDSGCLLDVRVDYSQASTEPVRLLAPGRDAPATLDSALHSVAGSGFQNDGDNEITGFHVSDGDPSARGLLGAKLPHPFHDRRRVFYTQQHGDNTTFEIPPPR